MSIDAVAIFRAPYTRFCEALALTPAADYATALEETFPVVPLGEDGTAVFLGIAFAGEPEELGAFARQGLGEALNLHDDARGFLVAPDVGWGDDGYASYETAIEYFGDAGAWIPQLGDEDAAAVMKERGAALYGPAFATFDAASSAAFVRAQLFGDGDAMKGAMEKMQASIDANPELLDAAEQMADQLMQGGAAGGAGIDLNAFFAGGDLMQMAQRMLGGLSPVEQERLQKMAANTFEKLGGQEGVDALVKGRRK